MRGSVSVTEVLDDAEDVVARVMAPWGGLLWLTALPFRLMQIHFLDRLAALAGEAQHYGEHLRQIALLTTAALLLALLGRVVFVRACTMSLRSGTRPGASALRVGLGPALSYLYVGLALEILFVISLPTFVAAPFVALVSTLAVATSPLVERPGLIAPWRLASRHIVHGRALLAFLFLFAAAAFIAAVNLYFLFRLGLWLAGGLPFESLTSWDALLSLSNRSFRLLLWAGTLLALEPFWLATLSVFVQKSLSRTSGEDLRITWERLRSEAASAP
jgi:hypothetical protein